MFLTGSEISEILRKEQEYIEGLKRRWATSALPVNTEYDLRIGKRTELMGDIQAQQEAVARQTQSDDIAAQ